MKASPFAAEALLDRGYGRPMQGVEGSGKGERPVRRLIEASFVTPPKRENIPIAQSVRTSVIPAFVIATASPKLLITVPTTI